MSDHSKKDHLLFNKIAAAVISALLVVMLLNWFISFIYQEDVLQKNAYSIEIPEGQTSEVASTEEVVIEEILPLLASANLEKGEKLSKKCSACHSFNDGGIIKQGPNLYNIVGTAKASVAEYSYSDAMSALGGDWDFSALNQFLYNPKKYVEKTKMNFAGFKKVQDRADIIAYLRSLSANPLPIEE